MKILHINSNYFYNEFYENQLDVLDNSVENIIFNPLRQSIKADSKYKYYNPIIIKKSDSFFSRSRLKRTFRYLEKNKIINNIDLVHAHTLTNDGLLAYQLFKKYKIPYVLTIRNTDVNFSFKYKQYMKKNYKNAILYSSLLIFPNFSYKNKVSKFFKNNKEINEKLEKSIVIPNGINQFWHSNKVENKKILNSNEINILFVGRINRYKNLHNILKAIEQLNKKSNIKYSLNVIGKIENKKYYRKLSKKFQFNYLGVMNKYQIKEQMKKNDIFAMPSSNETFGLVFIEALSQSLPIIYTKGEGIDGYFKDDFIGKAVNSKDNQSIAYAIKNIKDNYEFYQENIEDKTFLEKFNWENIGKIYTELYKKILINNRKKK